MNSNKCFYFKPNILRALPTLLDYKLHKIAATAASSFRLFGSNVADQQRKRGFVGQVVLFQKFSVGKRLETDSEDLSGHREAFLLLDLELEVFDSAAVRVQKQGEGLPCRGADVQSPRWAFSIRI